MLKVWECVGGGGGFVGWHEMHDWHGLFEMYDLI